jgi:hypothetical protein
MRGQWRETSQGPSYGRQERGRREGYGAWREEGDSSFIGQPNPEGTNQRTNVPPEDPPPDLSSSKPPSPPFFSSLTLHLPQSPPKSTPFYPCKAFPLCGFWCWPGSFIQCIFDNVVGHLPLFFHITFMYCAISGSLEISDVPGRHHITSSAA